MQGKHFAFCNYQICCNTTTFLPVTVDEQQNTEKASQLLLDSHIKPHLVEISSDVFPLLYRLSKANTHSTVTHHFLLLLLGNWLNSSSTEIINLRRKNANISRW